MDKDTVQNETIRLTDRGQIRQWLSDRQYCHRPVRLADVHAHRDTTRTHTLVTDTLHTHTHTHIPPPPPPPCAHAHTHQTETRAHRHTVVIGIQSQLLYHSVIDLYRSFVRRRRSSKSSTCRHGWLRRVGCSVRRVHASSWNSSRQSLIFVEKRWVCGDSIISLALFMSCFVWLLADNDSRTFLWGVDWPTFTCPTFESIFAEMSIEERRGFKMVDII